jgi:type II secretory pathway component PulF
VLIRVVPKFEQMFKEMELGALPASTESLLFLANTVVQFWYAWLAAIAGLIWFHQKWIAKKSGRLVVFVCLLIVTAGASVTFVNVALFEPMIQIMERIGGK